MCEAGVPTNAYETVETCVRMQLSKERPDTQVYKLLTNANWRHHFVIIYFYSISKRQHHIHSCCAWGRECDAAQLLVPAWASVGVRVVTIIATHLCMCVYMRACQLMCGTHTRLLVHTYINKRLTNMKYKSTQYAIILIFT